MNDPAFRLVAAGVFGIWAALGLWLLASFIIHMLTSRKARKMPKTYGPDTVPEVPKVPFSLNVVRENADGTRSLETHDFVARPDPSSGDFTRFAMAADRSNKGADESGTGLLFVIRDILPSMIDNSDGVPAQWEYQELPVKEPTDPLAWPDDEGQDDSEPKFRGPDGVIYPASQRSKFEAFEAGSSRRRLYHLLFEDSTARVPMQTVAEIMRDLFSMGDGERPTTAP